MSEDVSVNQTEVPVEGLPAKESEVPKGKAERKPRAAEAAPEKGSLLGNESMLEKMGSTFLKPVPQDRPTREGAGTYASAASAAHSTIAPSARADEVKKTWADLCFQEEQEEEEAALARLLVADTQFESRVDDTGTKLFFPAGFSGMFPLWEDILKDACTFIGKEYAELSTVSLAGKSTAVGQLVGRVKAERMAAFTGLKASNPGLARSFMSVHKTISFFATPFDPAGKDFNPTIGETWIMGKIATDYTKSEIGGFNAHHFNLGCRATKDTRKNFLNQIKGLLTGGDPEPAANLILGSLDAIVFGYICKVYRKSTDESDAFIADILDIIQATAGSICLKSFRRVVRKVRKKVTDSRGKVKFEEESKESVLPPAIQSTSGMLLAHEKDFVIAMNGALGKCVEIVEYRIPDDELSLPRRGRIGETIVKALYQVSDKVNRVLKERRNLVRNHAAAAAGTEKITPALWDASMHKIMSSEEDRKKETSGIMNDVSGGDQDEVVTSWTQLTKKFVEAYADSAAEDALDDARDGMSSDYMFYRNPARTNLIASGHGRDVHTDAQSAAVGQDDSTY